jgi:hypothetical protein
VSTNDTLTLSDEFIFATNNITLTLPTIVANTGKIFHIQNVGLGQINIVGTGVETINNENSLVLQYQHSAVGLIASATRWVVF